MAGKFEIKKSKSGKFHFNLKAGNGQVIFSSQMYTSKASAENGAESVKNNATNDQFERKESKNGEPYFVLKAANGEVLGKSEMYSSASAREKGIKSVMKNAPDAKIVDLTDA